MKEELTREVLEALKGCKEKDDCELCPSNDFCNRKDAFGREALLATALLEEMDKPKVWDGAPERAKYAGVSFSESKTKCTIGWKEYTRELPKTLTRQIAEEICDEVQKAQFIPNVDAVESLLNKYAAELGTTT